MDKEKAGRVAGNMARGLGIPFYVIHKGTGFAVTQYLHAEGRVSEHRPEGESVDRVHGLGDGLAGESEQTPRGDGTGFRRAKP